MLGIIGLFLLRFICILRSLSPFTTQFVGVVLIIHSILPALAFSLDM
jgi:hypothetical protein